MKFYIIKSPSGTFGTAVVDILCLRGSQYYQTTKPIKKGILEQLKFQT